MDTRHFGQFGSKATLLGRLIRREELKKQKEQNPKVIHRGLTHNKKSDDIKDELFKMHKC